MKQINNFLNKIKNVRIKRLFAYLIHILLIPIRAVTACKYLTPSLKIATRWIFSSWETNNFSYNLTDTNNNYLAHTISLITGQSVNKISGYIREINSNEDLKKHITMNLKTNPGNFNFGPVVAYGRRVGWYAVVRAMKPKVIVETGVDQGLGACIIVEALKKNAREGKGGRYFGTDILPEAGFLFTDNYKKYGEILYGDSIKSLKKFKQKIDIFINDSDHHSRYEGREYDVIKPLLGKDSIVMGDNSHESEELSKFADKTGMNFLFFKEQPKNHWYPGAGIGFAYKK